MQTRRTEKGIKHLLQTQTSCKLIANFFFMDVWHAHRIFSFMKVVFLFCLLLFYIHGNIYLYQIRITVAASNYIKISEERAYTCFFVNPFSNAFYNACIHILNISSSAHHMCNACCPKQQWMTFIAHKTSIIRTTKHFLGKLCF